jgi:SAM-dependent methyltransferase
MISSDAAAGVGELVQHQSWLKSHLLEAPNLIQSFLEGDGIALDGKKVIDIGTGDGLIAKSLSHLGNCDVLGVDLKELDYEFLNLSTDGQCNPECRHKFTFLKIDPNKRMRFKDRFDLAISWSAAEHIMDFQGTTNDVFRSLKKHGLFFLQTYPLWNSAWGHHLFEWLPRYFHLDHSEEEIIDHLSKMEKVPIPLRLKNGEETDNLNSILQDKNISRDYWFEMCKEVLESCNQISIQDIQIMLEKSGFVIAKVQLITSTSHLPSLKINMLDCLVDGVKLLAYKP